MKPHRVKRFELSRDARFLEKLTDVVGLYLNPPDQALVLCVDEKTQIQALDRTQPGLPMKQGRLGTMTHGYKRNGTTCLFAALEILRETSGSDPIKTIITSNVYDVFPEAYPVCHPWRCLRVLDF